MKIFTRIFIGFLLLLSKEAVSQCSIIRTITGPSVACQMSTYTYTTEAGMSDYQWSTSGGVILSGTGTNTVNIRWNIPGERSVSVNYLDTNACLDVSSAVMIVLVSSPSLTGNFTVCSSPLSLNGNTYTTEAGMLSYEWTVTGGTITSGGNATSNTVTINWNSSSPVMSLSVNYTTPEGCHGLVPTTKNITLTSSPASLTGATTACLNAPGNVYTAAAGKSDYVWSISGGVITSGGTATSHTATVTWTSIGTRTIQVQYTDTNNCPTTATTMNVNVLQQAGYISGTGQACLGSSLPPFPFPGQGNTGTYQTYASQSNYVWTVSPGGTIISGGTSSSYSVTVQWHTAGPQSVSVSFTNSSGCVSTTAVQNVTVSGPETPSVSGNTVVCSGPDGSTGNVYTTEAGKSNYQWTINGGTITSVGGPFGNPNPVTVTWSNPPGPKSISVIYYSQGCRSLTSAPLNVTMLAPPNPTISGNKTVCRNTTHTYTTEPGNTNYIWTLPPQGTLAGGGTTSDNWASVTWTEPGIFGGPVMLKVSYTDTNGCTGTSSPFEGMITVDDLSSVELNGQSIVCQGQTFYYQTYDQLSSYVWSVPTGGVITSGGTTDDSFAYIRWDTPGSHSVSLTGETSNGCALPLPDVINVTVNPSGTPTITGSSNACVVGNTYQEYTFTTEAGFLNYSWTIPSGAQITSGGNSNSVTVYFNSTGTKTISVSSYNGTCWSPVTTKSITVHEAPVPTINGNESACQNAPGNVYTTEAGMTNYQWTFSGGTITAGGAASDNTATVTWNGDNFNIVQLTYTNGIGCLGYAYKYVNVSQMQERPITGSATPCIETPQVYTTQSGKQDYAWAVTGGTITSGANTNTVTVTWNQPGNQSISVYYTDAVNCVSPTPTSRSINVYPRPVPTITGDNTACQGTVANIYSTETGKSNYVWTVTGGTISGNNNANSYYIFVSWNSAGNQSVSVTYNNENNCAAVTPAVKNVNVRGVAPTLTGNANACKNSTGNVYTTESGKSNYVWIVSSGGTITAGGTSASNTVTVTWNTIGARTVSVRYTDENNCTAVTPVVKNVTVHDLPVPTITGSLAVCQASPGNIYTTEGGNSNYVWTVSAGSTITADGTSTSNTATVTWNTEVGSWNPGSKIISVNYTDINGCRAVNPASRVVQVHIPEAPFITKMSGSQTSACADTEVIFSTKAGQNNYQWTVSPGGSIVSGEPSSTATVIWNQTGNQTITVNYTNPINCMIPGPVTKNISVQPRPVPPVNGNSIAMLNSTGNVYTTSGGTHTYLWNVSSGGTITAGGTVNDNSVTVTWNTLGPQTVSVNYTDDFQCKAIVPTVKNVSVNVPTYVTIPDVNFRNALKAAYPACFNANNEMDIYCSSVITATSMNVDSRFISNLSGLEYFINLRDLICSSNSLTSLPPLPPKLTSLNCFNNQITSLPSLPATLTTLECSYNQLTTLPALPSSLVALTCIENDLTGLPAIPGGLYDLTCNNNQITSIPPLPASLEILNFSNNQVASVANLPAGLTQLGCRNNNLTTLPTLPAGLLDLDVRDNLLTSLSALPPGLTSLDCSVNQLTALPAMPGTLTYLKCANNQLTSLPSLPTGLTFLDCSSNSLTSIPPLSTAIRTLYCFSNQLTALPAMPGGILDLLHCSNNQITSLPSVYVITYSNISSNRLDFADIENATRPPSFFADQSYEITPATQYKLLGQTLTINGAIGGSANRYLWYRSGVYTGITTAVFNKTNFTAADAGEYQCIVTSLKPGYSGITISSIKVNVFVGDAQVITFDPLPNKTYGDAPFTLSATGGGSGNPVTFTSSNPSVATISGNTVTITGAGSTTITANQQAGGTFAQAAPVARALTVNKASQTILNFDPIPAKTVGNVFTVSATSSSGLPVIFSSSITSIATVSGNQVTATGAGTGTIQAIQQGNTNYSPVSLPRTLQVYAVPVATIGGPTAFCGPSVVLTGSANSADCSYLWSTGATTQNITITSAGDYWLTVTNGAGYSVTSPTRTITNNTPTISVSGPTTICTTMTTTLTSSAGASYQWFRNGTATGQTSRAINVTQGGTYYVKVTTPTGCSGTLNAPPVIIESPYTISLYGHTTFCEGNHAELYSAIQCENCPQVCTNCSYSWSNGATSWYTWPTTPGTYTLSVTINSTGCTITSAPIVVTRIENTNGGYITSSSSCYSSSPVELTAHPAGDTYEWIKGFASLNMYTQTISVSSLGNYNVSIDNGSQVGCFDLYPCVYPLMALPEEDAAEEESAQVLLYPNPVDDELKIDLPEPATKRTALKMYDQMGKVVEDSFFETGESGKTIGTESHAPGVYLILIESEKGMLRRKVMVVHKN